MHSNGDDFIAFGTHISEAMLTFGMVLWIWKKFHIFTFVCSITVVGCRIRNLYRIKMFLDSLFVPFSVKSCYTHVSLSVSGEQRMQDVILICNYSVQSWGLQRPVVITLITKRAFSRRRKVCLPTFSEAGSQVNKFEQVQGAGPVLRLGRSPSEKNLNNLGSLM